MDKFEPINWFKAGFKNPVEYFKYAMDFEHDFSNIIITKFTICCIGCILTGIVLADNLPIYEFKSVLTISDNDTENHEGDFEIIHNNINYRIMTWISHAIKNKSHPTDEMIEKSNECISHIISESSIPNSILKIAMIAVSLKL
jgi:hypothetical protein